ncbi:uncharacterized protein L969DRAFT_16667 [Mixia osmundae IAM 14324]|uniref:Cytidine deaminase n=1 Tax=Mixia osmundae (strain CBS 9802 / IAM 14324 / JCM 22182 / KY 12970) TaxID=764103 RepID=G7E9P4_MIXOS|nr:uncharacterized protein L969DRAFT_16667 [Mixia osmundae IAM 14324]KEI39994.1 hypothetical protein L969DRAFT_16667 [Mixia osmundae IAM 14324]GAA99363.1 hypothetical protein E5Q_06059 [Mixia osmundae IAM 14324]
MSSSTLTDEESKVLIAGALKARDAAYCPYSDFRVGACLLADTGVFFMGCNVENASYGGTICAERTAVVKAVSEGARRFRAIAVATDLNEACSPCGLCRQVLREFMPQEAPILLVIPAHADAQGQAVEVQTISSSMAALLPMSFGPEHLDKPRNAPSVTTG